MLARSRERPRESESRPCPVIGAEQQDEDANEPRDEQDAPRCEEVIGQVDHLGLDDGVLQQADPDEAGAEYHQGDTEGDRHVSLHFLPHF